LFSGDGLAETSTGLNPVLHV
jgi:hypothetical protein